MNTGTEWFSQTSINKSDDQVAMTFTSTKTITTYSLRYTTGTGFTGKLVWADSVAVLVNNKDDSYAISATLPADTTGWYFSLSDGNVTASSDYKENISLIVTPSDTLLIETDESESVVSANVELGFIAPTNIEITSIEFSNASHEGAFSTALTLPLIVSDPEVAETVTVSFDNAIANISGSDIETATLIISWKLLDGTFDSTRLPIEVSVGD